MSHPIKIVSTQKSNVLDVEWTPNNICNYKCRYCFPNSNTGEYGSPTDLNLVTKNFNFLFKTYREQLGKTHIHFKIAGGEPTLWKDLSSFVNEIKKENDVYFTLITNGSRTLRWWKENGNIVDNVHLSYHVAQADIDHTIAVADTMYDFGKKITVKILMDLTCWEKCFNAVEYIKKKSKNRFMITVAEVIEPAVNLLGRSKEIKLVDLKYSQEQKKYLSKGLKRIPGIWWFWKNRHLIKLGKIALYESTATLDSGKKINARTETYINQNWNNFKGWKCNIGIDRIFIDPSGNIRGACGQYLFGVDFYYNILSSDFQEKFRLTHEPVICTKFNCISTPETHVTKFKI